MTEYTSVSRYIQRHYFIWQLASLIYSDRSTWLQGAQRSPVFEIVISEGPHVLLQFIVVNISLLYPPCSRKMLEMFSFVS